MSRYIDKDEFIKSEIERCGCVPVIGSCTADNESLKTILEQTPTIKTEDLYGGRRFIFLDDVYRVISGHSDYHGDNILSALTCIAEGKEVKPVKPLEDLRPKGKWIGLEYEGYADGNPVYDLWECSNCGNEEKGEDVPEQNPFCRCCGAKMDGDEVKMEG